MTVPLYLGLGASGGSYLKDVFYLNTFGVAEYINAIEDRGRAVALSVDPDGENAASGLAVLADLRDPIRQGRLSGEIRRGYRPRVRWVFEALEMLGFLRDDGERISLSDRGSFWLHACEDILSIDYISKLWGASKRDLWPEKVIL